MKLLEVYLQKHNTNMNQMHHISGLPETTVRNLNKKPLENWTMKQIDAVSQTVNKSREIVIGELERLNSENLNVLGRYDLQQRRYIGNKTKILKWISGLVDEYTTGNSFFDVFAGTGVVTKEFINKFDKFIINDFLFSNNVIYKAFFGPQEYNSEKLLELRELYNKIEKREYDNTYLEDNYGGKFFSNFDAIKIGEIRERIDRNTEINERERAILITSLLYSLDNIANTVGHYDAYRRNNDIVDKFKFELINPLRECGKDFSIFRRDANQLVREVEADVAFIDPPYNSRQYSRFYHVLESITKWDKPMLSGVAMKPPIENMSAYSKVAAPKMFDDLISNLNVNYIVVTYNNTYNSKSSSSKNKITHEQIIESLNRVGNTRQFEQAYKFFNTGKTDLKDHKEFVFITEVGVFNDRIDERKIRNK
ncbi:TPA: DNA adenine methylase [Staphylococcus aureus]|uniref:DNA adenine methylase n=1 Tax=Staphylococcus TaxID=1279 RepID=UPI000CCFE51C|nr:MULTISPECIES: DNA adenine methylase [Staphylococcus]MBN4862608.1 DNA adenine methylase [Staphylococcus sp. EG-SA-32]UVI92691.1 DNA adenine methylase [Staphylococcus aureus]CAC9112173.1 modification methylase FokI [Staphylococcus aureus]HAR6881700.1 adenine methyltransferase [Staphylococcus aureus]HAR7019935.1 adenine methyltransferase [Staphylococcus aureus]